MRRYTFHWASGSSTTVTAPDEWDAYSMACRARSPSHHVCAFTHMEVHTIPIDWATVGPELLAALNGMVETHRIFNDDPVLVEGRIQARRIAGEAIAKAEDPQ